MVRAFAWIAAGCALAVGCESSSPDWCPDLQGIPTETVTTPTSWKSPPELTEAWAVGGLTEGQEFVMPNAVAIDPNTGHIAVADFRLGNVAVISREGDWLTRLSKPGKGPGEVFRSPRAQLDARRLPDHPGRGQFQNADAANRMEVSSRRASWIHGSQACCSDRA